MGQQCSCNCNDAEQELYLDKVRFAFKPEGTAHCQAAEDEEELKGQGGEEQHSEFGQPQLKRLNDGHFPEHSKEEGKRDERKGDEEALP